MNPLYSWMYILAILLSSLSVYAGEVPPKVDAQLGDSLVKIASGLSPGDYTQDNEYGFIIYQIFGNGDCCNSRWYAVNIWTGDVWDTLGCKRMFNTTLMKEQEKIKQRFKKAEMLQYNRLHALRPMDAGWNDLCDEK